MESTVSNETASAQPAASPLKQHGIESRLERDLLITAVEINGQHGVGVLLQRLFPDSHSFVCIRSFSVYGGLTTFGSGHDLILDRPRHAQDVRTALTEYLGRWKIRRILCVPYYPADFVHAVVARELTGAPLVTYVMDDQNVFGSQVDDRLVERLLGVSDLRLGISWELCTVYERKFGRKFELLPPVLTAPAPFVGNYWQPDAAAPLRAAMIGNVWTAKRFRQLRAALKRAGVQIDWYGNGQDASWLEGSMEEWERDGIRCLGHLPEEDLVVALASYPYVLVPSGSCDDKDDNPAFSRLSLPSRMLFLHGRTDTPLLVLGSDVGAAGHFVQANGTGICTSNEGLREAQAQLIDPARRTDFRRNIRRLAPDLVFGGAGEWIWESLGKKAAVSAPFNRAFPPPSPDRIAAVTAAIPRRGPTARTRPAKSSPFAEIAYSTGKNFRSVVEAGLLPSIWTPQNAELATFMRVHAAWWAARQASPGDDLLFLGDEIPAAALPLFSKVRLWRLADPAMMWNGAPQTKAEYVPISPRGLRRSAPAQFDVIWSAGLADSIPEDTMTCDRIAAFCDAVCASGGSNGHFFAAVAHSNFNWVHPLHDAFLRRSRQEKNWPDFATIFEDEDAFFMSAAAYAQFWEPSTGRSAGEFGRCCWLGVGWKGPSWFNHNRRRFWQSPTGQYVIRLQQRFRQ